MRLAQWRWFAILALLMSGPTFIACTGEQSAGTGSVELTMSGGAALRQGFPHKEGQVEHKFTDGWTATFSKFVVVIGNMTLSRPQTSEVVGQWKNSVMVDMKSPDVQSGKTPGTVVLAEIKDVPAIRLNLGFSMEKATSSTENRNVDKADAALMIKNGWSVLFEGEVKRKEETVKFRFGLAVPTDYTKCTNGEDNTLGLAVEANKKTGALIYLHAVHLFWDGLGITNARLRFDPMAAVAGDDKLVTSDELKKQDLTQLKDADGKPLKDGNGKPILYDDSGLLPPENTNLLEFVRLNLRNSVHFNGLGLCNTKAK
jgi:hypothetical protein